jgi:dUTP pyrophosphatase
VVEIPVLALDPDLPLPAYARPGDGGADLVARCAAKLAPGGGRALVPTGIALAIPEGFAGFVQARSGLAARHGVTVLNGPGLIDAGYRDEIRVLLVNLDPADAYEVRRGDRIAQLVIQPVERASFSPAATLADSARGTGGFGHTGR